MVTDSGDPLIANAETILGRSLGGVVRLELAERLRQTDWSEGVRYRVLDGPSAAPPTIVVKKRASPDSAPNAAAAELPLYPAFKRG